MKSALSKFLLAALCAIVSLPVLAQDWPTRNVTVLVPFAAGGTVDIIARTVGQQLGKLTGQGFIVENHGGAAGTIAEGLLVHAPADGYTLLFHHMGLAFNATLYGRKLPFDTQKDIVPVALIGATPNVLVVNKSVPAKSVQEFLALAKSKPGTIAYGSGGVGSAGHLPMELLHSIAHVDLVHVPYKGSGPAITDLIGGQIQSMLLTIPAVMPYIASGQLRAIATTGHKRSPALPDLPTFEESGVKGFEYSPWYGVFARAGTPPAVLAKMHDDINKVLADPEVARKLGMQGLEVHPVSRERFAAMVHADIGKWSAIIARLGISQ